MLIDNGFIIFNDTDAQGDEEVGVMKIINGSNPPTGENIIQNNEKSLVRLLDVLGREIKHKSSL